MAPPDPTRKPSAKGKTPKLDLRKRKTGKKKDEEDTTNDVPKETSEVRLDGVSRGRDRTHDLSVLFSAPATVASHSDATLHPFLPREQERDARKKAAKSARKAKGESVLREGGTRPCKICHKVRRRRRVRVTATHHPPPPPRRAFFLDATS
jgi:hypothetical protein